MKMNKWFGFMLVFALVFTLAACGEKTNNQGSGNGGQSNQTPSNQTQNPETTPEAEGEPEIEAGAELLVWDNGDSEGDWAKYVAEEFTKQYGIPVTVEHVNHTDAPGKLQTDGPAGLGADVFNGAHDHTGNMAAAGLILQNFYADEYLDSTMDAALKGATFEDNLYGYPIAIETYGLYYNKDLVESAPDTWEELIVLAKEFTNQSEQKYGFMMSMADFYYDFAFIGGYGGYVFGENNTDPSDLGLNGEAAVKAARFYQRLKQEVLPLKKEDVTYDLKNSLFQDGQLMFDLNGPWALAGYREKGVNFGVAPIPKLENGNRPTSFSGIKSYYVNAYTKYPEAASLYAKFASSPEMLEKRFEITGQIPTRKDMLESDAIKQDEIASAFLEQAIHAVSMPNIPEMQNVWGPMAAAFSIIWNDNADPQKSLDDAVQQIKEGIQLMSGN